MKCLERNKTEFYYALFVDDEPGKDEYGNESIGIRNYIYLALSYDHRIIDGADAGRYLSAVKARLEEGDFAAEVGL